jgi:hypothetical protein
MTTKETMQMMPLNSVFEIDSKGHCKISIIRVPNGWIYTTRYSNGSMSSVSVSSVFVPENPQHNHSLDY